MDEIKNCAICRKLQCKIDTKMQEIIDPLRKVISALYESDDLNARELHENVVDLCFSLGLRIPAGHLEIKRKDDHDYTDDIFIRHQTSWEKGGIAK